MTPGEYEVIAMADGYEPLAKLIEVSEHGHTVAPMLNFELSRQEEEEEPESRFEPEPEPEEEDEFDPVEFAKRFADEGGFDNYMDQVSTFFRQLHGIYPGGYIYPTEQ